MQYRYDSYKQIDWAIKNHARFMHQVSHDKNRGTYSDIEDGHYRVYANVEGGKIMLLDIIGDKVLHIDKTYYQTPGDRLTGNNYIFKVQKIIQKYYS
jgi:hypothetical protein